MITTLAAAALVFGVLAVYPSPLEAGPIEQKRAEAAALVSRLDQQARAIVDLDRRYRSAQDRMAGAKSAVEKAQADLAVLQGRKDSTRQRLVGDAQAAYTVGGSTRLLNLTSPGGSTRAVSRAAYLRLVSGQERQTLEELRRVSEDMADQRSRLEVARGAARNETTRAATDRQGAQKAIAAQRSLLGQVNGQLAGLVAAEQARRDAATREAQRRAVLAAVVGGGSSARPLPNSRFKPSGPDSAPGVIDDVFNCIRQLESGNRYGSGGGGAYQFLDSTWQSLGYSGTARDAPPEVQDEAARRLQARSGWQQWTTARLCGRP